MHAQMILVIDLPLHHFMRFITSTVEYSFTLYTRMRTLRCLPTKNCRCDVIFLGLRGDDNYPVIP